MLIIGRDFHTRYQQIAMAGCPRFGSVNLGLAFDFLCASFSRSLTTSYPLFPCYTDPPGSNTREGGLTFTQRVLKASESWMLKTAHKAQTQAPGAPNRVAGAVGIENTTGRDFKDLAEMQGSVKALKRKVVVPVGFHRRFMVFSFASWFYCSVLLVSVLLVSAIQISQCPLR